MDIFVNHYFSSGWGDPEHASAAIETTVRHQDNTVKVVPDDVSLLGSLTREMPSMFGFGGAKRFGETASTRRGRGRVVTSAFRA